MTLYSLIAVAWDATEGQWYPVRGVTSHQPFLMGGYFAFVRPLYPLYSYELCVISATSTIDGNGRKSTCFSGIDFVAETTHLLCQYSDALIGEYYEMVGN